jgi:glycosyltransferase involved in cell wall biosynthesis
VLNGIDAERFVRDKSAEETVRAELSVPPGAFVIGSVGRLEPQKRFDLLLDAVMILRVNHPSIFVIIAGSGSLHAELQAHIDRTGLGQSARLLGHCRDIPRLHHALDMFVQSSDYEGTSNAVLEAMAMGTPVVATDAGGTAELLRDGVEGLIVPRASTPALTAAISTLLIDAPLRERLRHAARERVEGPLSFASRMAAVEEVYRELRPAGSRGDA